MPADLMYDMGENDVDIKFESSQEFSQGDEDEEI